MTKEYEDERGAVYFQGTDSQQKESLWIVKLSDGYIMTMTHHEVAYEHKFKKHIDILEYAIEQRPQVIQVSTLPLHSTVKNIFKEV